MIQEKKKKKKKTEEKESQRANCGDNKIHPPHHPDPFL